MSDVKPPRRSKRNQFKTQSSTIKSPPTSDYDSDPPGYFSGASCDCDSYDIPDPPSVSSPTGDLNSSLYGSKKKPKNPFDYARKLVSRHKKRYEADGYNLDLAYVTDNIIAMGFPSLNFEKMYRNPYPQVFKFLEEKHKDHYKVYNLCIEKTRQYDNSLFHNRVSCFPFSDHNAPSLQLIYDFCKDIDQWLKKDKENIAAVHCKAGKGRTGVMICCYLMYIHQFVDPIKCMHFYAARRTEDEQGVTIPSQRRFVVYWGEILKQWYINNPKMMMINNKYNNNHMLEGSSAYGDDEDDDDDDDDDDGSDSGERSGGGENGGESEKNRNNSIDFIFGNNNIPSSINSDIVKGKEPVVVVGGGIGDEEEELEEDNNNIITDLYGSVPPSIIPPRRNRNKNKFKTFNGSSSVDTNFLINNQKKIKTSMITTRPNGIPPLSPLRGINNIHNNNPIIDPSPILFNRYKWNVNYGQLPSNIPLTLTMIRVTTGSDEVLGFKCTCFTVESGSKKYHSDSFCTSKVINRHFSTTDTPTDDIIVNGEVKIVFFYKTDFVCGFWFHSSFVIDNKLVLNKNEIDGLVKDDKNKKCPKGTRIELYFNHKLPN